MKKVKSLIILLSIILVFCLSTSVKATDFLVDVTANSAGKTNTANTANTANITEIDTPTFSTVNQTVYATANVNITSSYSTSSSAIGTLSKDQSITRTGTSNNGWSRVKTSTGTTGYIESKYLTTTAPTPVNINQTNNNSSNYNNTTKTNNTNTLPQTGIGDNTGMWVIIGICIVSAIYAYKKIRDYNI